MLFFGTSLLGQIANNFQCADSELEFLRCEELIPGSASFTERAEIVRFEYFVSLQGTQSKETPGHPKPDRKKDLHA